MNTPKSITLVFEAEVPGRPIVKKNSQRVVGFGKRKRKIDSPQYSRWHKVALLVLKQARLRRDSMLLGELHASYRFHFKNHQAEADVSNLIEGPQDCLAESLIIENDKQITSLDAMKLFDGTEKTIVRLYELGVV